MKRKTTTPEEEGIEMRPDAWAHFEDALKTIARQKPKDRAEKQERAKKPKGAA